ncbi:MAG: hypothetical protein ACJAZ2_000364 [Glaciecola sp.]|jgi:hypothetical protein
MILFGRKAHHLGLTTSKKIPCEKCAKKHLAISVFQKYFHILWLPMFPIKKECASQCIKCQNVLIEKRFSDKSKEIAITLKKKYKTPFFAFSGIFLGFLILLVKNIFW